MANPIRLRKLPVWNPGLTGGAAPPVVESMPWKRVNRLPDDTPPVDLSRGRPWDQSLTTGTPLSQIVVVQSLTKTESNSTSSLQSVAFGSSPTTGNTIIVFIAMGGTAGVSSITDTQGNSYSVDVTASGQAGKFSTIWHASNITGGAAFKITVNVSFGPTAMVFGAVEVSGLAVASLDKTNSNVGTATTTPTTGSVTTTHDSELVAIVTAEASNLITFTEPTGFTSRVQESGATFINMDGATKVLGVISTLNPQWTTTNAQFSACIATYNAGTAANADNIPWFSWRPENRLRLLEKVDTWSFEELWFTSVEWGPGVVTGTPLQQIEFAPWKIRRSPETLQRLLDTLAVTFEDVRQTVKTWAPGFTAAGIAQVENIPWKIRRSPETLRALLETLGVTFDEIRQTVKTWGPGDNTGTPAAPSVQIPWKSTLSKEDRFSLLADPRFVTFDQLKPSSVIPIGPILPPINVVGGFGLVPRVPDIRTAVGQDRLRRHTEIVASILNSLQRRGDIKSTGADSYKLAYTPGAPGNWMGIAPTDFATALDRIAAALATLGQKP